MQLTIAFNEDILSVEVRSHRVIRRDRARPSPHARRSGA